MRSPVGQGSAGYDADFVAGRAGKITSEQVGEGAGSGALLRPPHAEAAEANERRLDPKKANERTSVPKREELIPSR